MLIGLARPGVMDKFPSSKYPAYLSYKQAKPRTSSLDYS
jgi:hypothetical protein